MKKNLLLLLVVFVLSIPAVIPLFSSGFYPMHDDTQVARVSEMKEALSEGQFPVRWVENLGYGYGYPIFNFYAPFAYYIGGLINLIGFDSLTSTKIMIGLGTILAGFSMYFFAREFWGRSGGLVAAILYVYAPYHALNLYVRGAIAELWAYALIPFVFWGLYKLYADSLDKNAHKYLWKWVLVTAISFAGVVLSHNLTAFMVTPIVAIFAGILLALQIRKNAKNKFFLPLSLLIGGLLSAFYWLPVLTEMKYTNVLSVVGGGSDYPDHFICLRQLWDSPWAFGGSLPGCSDGMSFKIGKLHIALGVISVVILFIKRKQNHVTAPLLLSYFGLVLSIFLTLEQSQFIWDAIQQMSFYQFPWRYLLLISFFISFIGAAVVTLFRYKAKFVGTVLLIAITIAVNLELFVPSINIQKTNEDYTSKQSLQWTTSRISDEYMPQGFQRPIKDSELPKAKVQVDNKVVKIISVTESVTKVTAMIDAEKDSVLQFNIAYFPAWKVFIDGKEAPFKNTSKGIQVSVSPGSHIVTAQFIQTPIQQLGNVLSLTGVILLFIGIITQRKGKKKIAKSS